MALNEPQQTEKKDYPVIAFPPTQPGQNGPPCIWDNAPTVRTGSCFTCIACGNASSCG